MNEKELKNNHDICLELLDRFLEICEKYDITYYMAFGSCLGAIRHKGFIPWDINIDVLLTASEYHRLDKVIKNEDLGDMEWCYPENSARMYPLLRKKDSWTKMNSNPNLDVSVYYNAPNNRLLRILLQKLTYLNRKAYKLKMTNVRRAFPYNVFKVFASIIPNSFYLGNIARIEKLNSKKPTEYQMVVLPSVWGNKEMIKTAWIGDKPVYAEFEGRKVRILEDYDSYLTLRYGDYMKPIIWEDKGEYMHQKK